MAHTSRTALEETGKTGEFKRTDADYRNWITADGPFTPDADRYHLYISLACPWASRCLATVNLKGLQKVIGLSIVHPTWQRTRPDDPEDHHTGWAFASPEDPPFKSIEGHGSFKPANNLIPDSVNGARFIRDLYEKSGGALGKYSVPVLWDKRTNKIVSNESADIIRMLNSAFNHLAKHADLDLLPAQLQGAIDEANAWTYPNINNGVYRAGFATSQGAYETAFRDVFGALDRAEEVLSRQRYIAGDAFTEADVRLFPTLIRFDPVYVVYFKTNKSFINQYPNLADYTRELYQMPGMREAVDIEHIKLHYFTSHPKLNTYAVVPVGPDPWWEEPHKRGA